MKVSSLMPLVIISCIVVTVNAQEYINDTFSSWNNAGSGTNVWADGVQESVCFDGETRVFQFKQCIVNNIEVPADNSCTLGGMIIRNSNNGILTLPVLPNIGLIMIAREGKPVDRNCKLRLQYFSNGSWFDVERDGITATSGCEIYTFNYRSENEVQLRFQLEGNSATRLYWLYIEGIDEPGSRTPYVPDDNLPLPDESTVNLLDDKAATVAFETLVGISSYGWDPVNNGIYINWHREFTNRINNSGGGDWEERNTPTRHDTQNDVRALQHYYWFKYLHPETDYFDQAIKRLLPKVKSKFARPSSLKGWLYYVLLRLYEYTDNPDDKKFWEDAIIFWAENLYKTIDPELGIFVQENMGNCDCGTSTIYLDKAYRVDYQVHSGAALVDVGTRFNRPDWVAAGYRQVLTAYEQSFSEEYGLFGRIYLLGTNGWKKNADGEITVQYDYSAFQNKLWDGQSKVGEVSEEVDALIRAAEITTDPVIKQKFIEIATKMLNALRTQIIHDKQYGGFFQLMYIADSGDGRKAGELNGTKKEMRQASLLGTFNLANRLIGPYWQDLEKEMYHVLVNAFDEQPRGMYLPDIEISQNEMLNKYRKTLAGYTFMLNADWSLFTSSSKVLENWVSNESNSLILLGLFEYLTAKYKLNYNTDHISSTTMTTANTEKYFLIKEKVLHAHSAIRQYTLFDSTGKVVVNQKSNNQSFDMSHLCSGLYIAVGLLDSGNMAYLKIIL